VQVLELDFERLFDLDDFIFAHFFHITHISEESDDAVEGDWVPVEMELSDLDVVIHEHIGKTR
jgi:hypothetical protein